MACGMMLTETTWRSMPRHRISFLPCCHATPRWSYIIYNVLFLIEFPSSVVPSVFFLVSRDSWSKLRSPLARLRQLSLQPSSSSLGIAGASSALLSLLRQLSLRPSSSSLGIAGASSALLSLLRQLAISDMNFMRTRRISSSEKSPSNSSTALSMLSVSDVRK